MNPNRPVAGRFDYTWGPVPNHVIILAAGRGARMRSARPKVLTPSPACP